MANSPQLSSFEDDQEKEVHLVLIQSRPNSELPGGGPEEVKEREETAYAGEGNGIPHTGSSENQQEEKEGTKRILRADKEDDDDGYHTPTSPRHRIPAALECPPAPRKPRAQPMSRKRKQIRSRCREFHVVRQRLYFVLSPLLHDLASEIKKGRTEGAVE